MRIFVVSLKSEKNRRKIIINQFKKLGVKFEFFDAVDCRGGISDKYNDILDMELAAKRLGRVMTNGEVGCSLSHHLLYKKIVKEKIKDAIIIEDDAILTPALKDFINMKNKSDFVMLYHYRAYANKLVFSNNKTEFYNIPFMPFSTAGYYINNKTAKIILNNNKTVSYVADWSLPLHEMVDCTIASPRVINHPEQDNQTSISGRPVSVLLHRISMLLCIRYFSNIKGYGSFCSYIKRTYLFGFYKCISPKVEGK